MEQYQQSSARIYPAAALYLGSTEQARAAVIEAIAAAERRSPAPGEAEMLSQLLRICQSRAPERVTQTDFPDDSALLPLLKLPASGRRDLALHLSDIPDETAAAVRQLTQEEFAHKIEKALRQLTFLQNGEAPDEAVLRNALHAVRWTSEDAGALQNGIAAARGQEAPAVPDSSAAVRDISHKRNEAQQSKKTVTVPLWTIIAGGLCIAALCVSIVISAVLRNRSAETPALPAESSESAEYDPKTFERMQSSFLSIREAQDAAVRAAGLTKDQAVFISTKLKPAAEPPYYEADLLSQNGQEYVLKLHAESGEVLGSDQFTADHTLDTEGWLEADDLRERALGFAGLEDALFLKEKCANEDTLSLCKYELTDAGGRIYTVQLEAKTGALVKFSVEEPPSVTAEEAIPLDAAKKKALSRVGDYDPEDVIFTKTKFEGSVYMIAFTLDDGTQYAIELNAADGSTNNVDVHPTPADTSHAIGLLRAREIVLEKAGLTGDDSVRFTKAKIDRNNGAYVYELEFETGAYEYEVSLKIDSGEMIKYRAWSLV